MRKILFATVLFLDLRGTGKSFFFGMLDILFDGFISLSEVTNLVYKYFDLDLLAEVIFVSGLRVTFGEMFSLTDVVITLLLFTRFELFVSLPDYCSGFFSSFFRCWNSSALIYCYRFEKFLGSHFLRVAFSSMILSN